MDLSIYKIDLDTDQPNGGKGESPRSAFTKYNNSLDTINGELTTLGESVDTINGELTTLDGSAMKKADNLSNLTNAATARGNLGLKGAATRDVGTSSGNVMQVGAFGLGYLPINTANHLSSIARFMRDSGTAIYNVPSGFNYGSVISVPYDADYSQSLSLSLNGRLFYTVKEGVEASPNYVELHTTGNTTVDPNGFIKKASPIVNLFSNSIEKTEHLEIASTELECMGVGHYVLHNVPLLSRDGWYIETPKDRNNNIYFYLDYEENETDKTLTIKTYEPDYSSGRAEAGEPVDILEGRFVSLRFEELTEE